MSTLDMDDLVMINLDMTDIDMADLDMANLDMIDSDLIDRKREVDRNSQYLLTLHAERDGIQMTSY